MRRHAGTTPVTISPRVGDVDVEAPQNLAREEAERLAVTDIHAPESLLVGTVDGGSKRVRREVGILDAKFGGGIVERLPEILRVALGEIDRELARRLAAKIV